MEQLATQTAQTMADIASISLPASTLYIGINVLLSLVLALLVVRARVQTKTTIGDGDNPQMIKALRAHGNNVEYVPLALITIAAVELTTAPVWLVHVLGVALSVGRVAHAVGLYQSTGASPGRFIGTILTWLVLLFGGLMCIYYALS